MTLIVHLEDNILDHKLVNARLQEEGLAFESVRVETEQELASALVDRPVDLVLADYNLPHFNGAAALQMVLTVKPEIPVIMLSGALGELAGVDILKAGATDCVLKDRLERLGPAVRRALREAGDRRARTVAEAQVREARDLAEAANRAKDQFLAVLSHELRTPLTPALATLQMMEADPALPGTFKESVQMIRRNVQLEVKLIDDLLDLTRITRDKVDLHLQSIDAAESLRQVIAICQSDIDARQINLHLNATAARPIVKADSARLQQILWNLLKNAIKFTPARGRIDISLHQPSRDQLEISISDTGIGIAPETLPKIFDAFEQGGKQVTRQFGGLGLGLAISRAMAVAHGGSLIARSDGLGKGASFILRLPLDTVTTTVTPATKPATQGKDLLKDCRVLLVDDHIDTAKAMGRLLKIWGCDVQTANSVQDALQVAQNRDFDVLISDIGLPDGSGLDIIQNLKQKSAVRGIAVSGFGMEEDLNQSQKAGFSEHLVKPVDLGLLEITIRRLLSETPCTGK